jgi:hypothetical protein
MLYCGFNMSLLVSVVLKRKLAAGTFLFGFVGKNLPCLFPAAFYVCHGECVAKPGEDLFVGVVAEDSWPAKMICGS